ncbi:tobamovirus multiplication protein 1 isoform X2 [Amborella trichopoda]|uniref:tobamovirus multiplication protein 1 isoform X2 n=1 Tax=Amborella trichopoda TaxID=13333 RepID=UPI0005D38C99|nr:tobamovirus multiplication protein 1 isoform X2 [Amborella trichopoda]|eukprot:XP_011624514.1 tobamovirus multiplication protein 1 isoform X2 [Amborella trichopoda]
MKPLDKEGHCLPRPLAICNISLACIDGLIAAIAFSQLLRIHLGNQQVGWTRQKVFLVMIGSSNAGYLIYFLSNVIANCNGWFCWLHACGFILMAFPQILFLGAFLLLLSFWVDLCHQAIDEDEEDKDDQVYQVLLEKTKNRTGSTSAENYRKCCSWHIHVGSRQKFVIMVLVLILVLMVAFSVLIWVGMGKNPINSSVMARIYSYILSVITLLVGGGLACYGLLIFLKMRRVRSDKVSSEMRKVAGLAAAAVVCFTSCALVALVTDIPVLNSWHSDDAHGIYSSFITTFYYFIGSSIPSIVILWVMREAPPRLVANRSTPPRPVMVIRESRTPSPYPHHWLAATTSSQPQAAKGSPI